MREVERQVMLRIIDQRWREHLEEMDYLKEGINLRAMGQKDPLTEWQREGYEMFGAMMKGIAQDFVRYVMHVQVVRNDPQPATVQNVSRRRLETADVASVRPPPPSRRRRGRRAGEARVRGDSTAAVAGGTAPAPRPAAKQETVVKDEWAKTPQRPVPVRVGQEVQDVPRRELTPPASADA